MGNKMVYVEKTENGTTTKNIVEVENKVLEVESSDTSLSATSTDTIETEIVDGAISSELKKGSVTTEYLSSDLQQKVGKETLPLKKLFLQDRLPTKHDRIKDDKILKGNYDINGLLDFINANPNVSFELVTTFKVIERGEEYVKIDIHESGNVGFITADGLELQAIYGTPKEWEDESLTKIQIEYDTEITQEQYEVLKKYFSIIYSAEEIIVLNREKIGYDFTPMLFQFKRRNRTFGYQGWYTAKSLFSRKKRIGYKNNGMEIPKRISNMTLFDLLEWFGISSEGNNEYIWYLKDEIEEYYGVNLSSIGKLGFSSEHGNKNDCEKYFVIPLRASEQIREEKDFVAWTIANSDILEINMERPITLDRPKWTHVLYNMINEDEGSYTNFFVRMGVGKVEETTLEDGTSKALRYEIQDAYRISVRMQISNLDQDFNGDFIGEMIISFKGCVEK